MTITRKDYQKSLLTITKGIKLRGHTRDTLSVVNFCAQFVRQNVESIEGLTPGTWAVAAMALSIARERGRPGNRYAVDYEEAGRRMGLGKNYKDIKVGDIGYWQYKEYGHTAQAVMIDGVIYWLENTNATVRAGGRRVFPSVTNEDGQKVPGKVWLTPLETLGKPRTLISPTLEIANMKDVDEEVKDSTAMLEAQQGQRVIVIINGSQQELGILEKATHINGKLYFKIKQK